MKWKFALWIAGMFVCACLNMARAQDVVFADRLTKEQCSYAEAQGPPIRQGALVGEYVDGERGRLVCWTNPWRRLDDRLFLVG
jgi:hypothetical protein